MLSKYFVIEMGLIAAGVILLVMSLFPVKLMIQQLPDGPIRSRWRILAALICLFISGYLLYALLHTPSPTHVLADVVVPGIFFGGAIFVYLVCALSLKTTLDLRQIFTLEQEIITDPLMGIYNRRYLDRRLTEEIQRARRYELPFSIFLLDIDYFKAVNDVYGHQIGDMVLKKLATVIVDSVRELDVVIRYGGEEILVILPNTRVENAEELAGRVRQRIEETVMLDSDPEKSRDAIRITASIGVAGYQFTGSWDTARRIVERADKALYMAKSLGRNQVISSATFTDPPPDAEVDRP